VTDWFEAGLYLPLYTHDKHTGWGLDGVKLRTLFAVPHADDRRFVYGANFEFSYNAKRWDEKRFTSEVSPIIGWHLKPLDVIVDPIRYRLRRREESGLRTVDTGCAHPVRCVDPGRRGVCRLRSATRFYLRGEQAHQLFGSVDRCSKVLDVEFGASVGLTDASNRFTMKLMLARDLN